MDIKIIDNTQKLIDELKLMLLKTRPISESVSSSFNSINSIVEILSNVIQIQLELYHEIDKIQSNDIKPLENSFVAGILNKIVVLKNIVKKNIGSEDSEVFSPTLVAIERIEEDIRNTKGVTQRQLKELNDIHLREKNYKKI